MPLLEAVENCVFDSLSIETTLSIELDVSQNRAKLDFGMPLTERLNDARYGAVNLLKNKREGIGAALIKQHKIVFGNRRSFGYAVSPFCRSISKDAGSIPTRS